MKYHLTKRKQKGKVIYYARFYDEAQHIKGTKIFYTATKSTGETSKARARDIADKMIKEGKGEGLKTNLETFLLDFWTPGKSEYLRSIETEQERQLSPIYCESNRSRIEHYFLPWMRAKGVTTLAQLNHSLLLSWRNDLAEGKILPPQEYRPHVKKFDSISRVGMNKIRQAVWVALGWATECGLLAYHPGAKVRKVGEAVQVKESQETRQSNMLELPEARKLFHHEYWVSNYSDDSISRACALFCFTTGARIGEARGLQFKNINLTTGFCNILANWQDETGLKPPKWNSHRKNVPIPDITIEAIQGVIQRYPHPEPTDNDFVFPNLNDRNKPINKATLNNSLKRALKRAGIDKGTRFHDLRHSFASHGEGQIPENIRRSILGHTQQATTDIYTHLTEDKIQQIKNFSENLLHKPNELKK